MVLSKYLFKIKVLSSQYFKQSLYIFTNTTSGVPTNSIIGSAAATPNNPGDRNQNLHRVANRCQRDVRICAADSG